MSSKKQQQNQKKKQSNNKEVEIVDSKNQETDMILNKEEEKKAQEIAKNIDLDNEDDLIHFGLNVQEKISNYSDNLIQNMEDKDDGYVKKYVNSLMKSIEYVDADGRKEGFIKRGIRRLPYGDKLYNRGKQIYRRFNSISDKIDNISKSLLESKQSLQKDNNTLEVLWERNVEYIREIKLDIEALKKKISEIEDVLIPQKEKEFEENPEDEILQQEIYDLKRKREILYTKLDDLTTSKTIANQSLPEIRMIQKNNQDQIQNINSAIVNTIPIWKNKIALKVSINNQKRAVDSLNNLNEATNKTLVDNAKSLKQNSEEIANQNNKSSFDTQKLEEVNKTIIETLENMKNVNNEKINRIQERQKVYRELEGGIKSAFTNVKKQLKASDGSNSQKRIEEKEQ